jgi:hypothetical protein
VLEQALRGSAFRVLTYICLTIGTLKKWNKFKIFDMREPLGFSVITGGSRNIIFSRMVVNILMRIRPEFIGYDRDAVSQYEGIVEVHIEIFAMRFDITFSGFYKPVNPEIILLRINAF